MVLRQQQGAAAAAVRLSQNLASKDISFSAATALLQHLPDKQQHQQQQNTEIPTSGGTADGITYKQCCHVRCEASYLRMFHLACITVMATSFIVECILMNLIILPYLTEAKFQPTRCRFNSSAHVTFLRCENKCSKDRSQFPCRQISVKYLVPGSETLQLLTKEVTTSINATVRLKNRKQRSAGIWKMGYLHDYHTTYNYHKNQGCATSPCYKLEDDNVKWVEHFTESLRSMREFSCYFTVESEYDEISNDSGASDENGIVALPHDHILLYKLHSSTVVWNCVVWPAGLMLSAVFSIIGIYASNQCHVWDTEKTVIA